MDGSAQRTVPPRGARTYPLSPAQTRLWLLSMVNEGSPEFNVTLAWRLRGTLDTTLLRRALEAVTARHEPLRTRFPLTDDGAVQLVEPDVAVPWRTDDVRALPADAREEALLEAVRAEALIPFGLASAPLLRCLEIRLADDDLAVVLTLHHLITDGWSMGILVNEWSAAYAALSAGRSPRFKPLAEHFGDDAARRRERIDSGALGESLAWWRKRLAGVEPLELPADLPRARQRDWRGGTVDAVWRGRRYEALTAFARARRTTLFTVLVAAFTTVLSRYAGSRDIAVGLPVAGRDRTETEDLIGLFFDTVVLRTDLSGEVTFAGLLERVQEGLLDAYEHQDVPFEKVVEALAPERDAGRTPVFQVWCEMDNTDRQELALPGVRVDEIDVPTDTAKFDVSLSVRQRPNRLELSLGYRKDLFTRKTAERWQQSLDHVLAQAMAHAERPVERLAVLPEEEIRRVVDMGRGPHIPPADDVLTRFEQRAGACPDSPAVVSAGRTLSYAELDALAERIAHVLRRSGTGTEDRVAVCLERGPQLVAAFLGTWKAGAAYVPLEPAHPAERAAYVLQDTGARVVLTQRAFADRFTDLAAEVVCLDTLDRDDAVPEPSTRTSQPPIGPATLAYVIYTSGSTGRPKGVMVEHGPLANFVQSCVDRYALLPTGGAALFASVAFDAVVPNILTPLVLGQPLHVLPESLDLADLGTALAAHGPYSFLKLTPSHLNLLAEQLTPEQAGTLAGVMVVGAEAFPARTLRAWRKLDRQSVVLNEYGPTEATVANSLYTALPCDEEREGTSLLPIGKPIANTTMHVLDDRMRPVPVGVVGEVHIGGGCLARGYRNMPAQTAARFRPDPFSRVPGARLYATGDLGRLLPDGDVDFLGRADDQIKIRGFRIEPGEIEHAATRHPDVIDAHVAAVPTAHGPELAAWVVLRDGHAEDWRANLRAHLSRLLPDHMRPAHHLSVTAIPLTPHGKTDRKALPAPEPTARIASRPPTGPREEAVAAVWRDLLRVQSIGADDNLFALGASSLIALHAVAQLRRELDLRIGMQDLFARPTIAALAQLPTGFAAEKDRAAASPLVTLRPGTGGVPLFCVHPSGGSVHWYTTLADVMHPDEGLLAFHALDLHRSANPPGTVTALAESYLKELRAARPHGPYRLLGWSYSGMLVLEMATRLRAAGERVEPLILLEPTLPDPHTVRVLTSIARTNRQAAALVDAIGRAGAQNDDTGPLRAELRRVLTESDLPEEAREEDSADVLRNAALLLEAFVAHHPKPYDGDVKLLVTPECMTADTRTPSQASGVSYSRYLADWRRLVRGSLSVHETPGDHMTMLHASQVGVVADVLYGRRTATARY
ncbi:amino acid adenylation domain-containing protein [Streptomyces sp. NPDC049915]|uniref:non-ribosomal peptide synthetase n=1 Tax=Streptomyces sp. NPDC049915 TaxID=3155510 RepID=UPI003418CE07